MNNHFNCGRYSLPLSKKVYVMGVLNVTPDSFSDGGLYTNADIAVFHALEMCRLGADIIDIGAVSTAPGSSEVSSDEEIRRLCDIVERLVPQLDIPLSLDTTSLQTAQTFLDAGVSIINDVSGTVRPDMAKLVASHGAGWIVTHGGNAGDGVHRKSIIGDVNRFFSQAVVTAAEYGVDNSHLCLDCGIGFSKSRENDLELLKGFGCLRGHGCALLAGASRKRVVREASGEETPEKTDDATVAAHTAAILGGANIIRAHDVSSAVLGARMAFAVKNSDGGCVSNGKIEVRGLKIFARHGVNPEEKQHGQFFVLDLDIFTDLNTPCHTDSVDDTVSYAAVLKCVRASMTENTFDLIERAAFFTAQAIFERFPQIEKLRILLKKPDAPVKAEIGYAGVELEINREDVINRKDGGIYCE